MNPEKKSGKNTMTDLNNHLFEQLTRLNDEKLKGAKLEEEIERSKAVTSVAKEIISNGKLVLEAKIKVGDMIKKEDLPKMLE